MGPEILEIQPRELEFIVEVKKQSTCSVKLVNNTDQYVAFKVKTTSPKKYCVRPNTGIIQPMSTCDFTGYEPYMKSSFQGGTPVIGDIFGWGKWGTPRVTMDAAMNMKWIGEDNFLSYQKDQIGYVNVTMQALKVAPPDLQCKDKFLIQSTVVPYGTAAEAVTTGMFAKDNGKYIQENKLKVVLVSPPNSPILQPISGSLKQEFDVSTFRDKVQNRVETRSLPPKQVAKDSEELKPAQDVEELKQNKDVNLKLTKDLEELELGKDLSKFKFAKYLEELKPIEDSEELKPIKEVEELKPNKEMEELKPIKEVEELKPAKELDDLKPAKEVEELKPTKEAETFKPNIEMEDWKSTKEANLKSTKEVEGLKATNDVKEVILTKGVEESKLAKDVELLKSNLKVLESKLNEAEVTIAKLREERIISTEERQTLQQQLAMLRRDNGVKRVQAGFPFLFVCMVALIGVALGYLLRRQG